MELVRVSDGKSYYAAFITAAALALIGKLFGIW